MNPKTIQALLDSHPLAPLMILEAVNRFTTQVAESTPDQYPPMGLINAEAWIELAKEMQKTIKG
jgi:hypothetical protein